MAKDIYEIFNEGYDIVKECCGDVIEPIKEVKINTRSKKRFGVCKYNAQTDTNVIEISERILGDNVPDDMVLTVMVHEILHATYGCHNHGKTWQNRAQQVMNKYPELKIRRCNSSQEFGIEPYVPPKRIYAVQCPSCHTTWRRARKTKLISMPHKFTCRRCNEKLVRV